MKMYPFAVIAPLVGGALLVTSACRKRVSTAPLPNLSAPERAFNSSPPSAARQTIPPEIEVKASSGPVELSLSLYKTKIAGESPWYRVRLKNLGKNKIRVLNDAFLHPYSIQTRGETNNSGIYLEVLDSAGKTPWPRPISDANFAFDQFYSQPVLSDKAHAEIARWKKEGIGDVEFAGRVRELIQREHPPVYTEPPAFWMEPGASTATVAWAYQDAYDIHLGKPARKPIGDFAELSHYLLPPGNYRIRAVYDMHVSPEGYKEFGGKNYDWEIVVRTPFINFEVLR